MHKLGKYKNENLTILTEIVIEDILFKLKFLIKFFNSLATGSTCVVLHIFSMSDLLFFELNRKKYRKYPIKMLRIIPNNILIFF